MSGLIASLGLLVLSLTLLILVVDAAPTLPPVRLAVGFALGNVGALVGFVFMLLSLSRVLGAR